MDSKTEFHARMQITKLEAKLAMCEIEIANLNRILRSPRTTQPEIIKARVRVEALETECAHLADELAKLRRTYPGLKH